MTFVNTNNKNEYIISTLHSRYRNIYHVVLYMLYCVYIQRLMVYTPRGPLHVKARVTAPLKFSVG